MPVVSYRALFCVLMISSFSLQNEEEETNPFVEAARSLLQDSLSKKDASQGIGGLVQSFMQGDGGKQLGEMFGGQGADLMSGFGSLLAASQGGGGGQGLNPQLIGQMVEIFSGFANQGKEEESNSVDDNNNEIRSRSKGKQSGDGGGMNWEAMMDIAATFMSQGQGQGQANPLEGLMNLLPALLQTGHAHHEDETEDREEHQRHERASSLLPPVLNTAYTYWEHFKESELGHTLWSNSGLEAIFQLFTDEQGHFQSDRIFESMENHAFRRRWIRSLTSFAAEWVKHVADPATQARYLTTVQFMANGFLKSQGYPKSVHFDPTRPSESLSQLANTVLKKQFGLKVNSGVYIKPAVTYIQELLTIAQSKGRVLSYLSSQDIESKLAETVNGEVLEPVLRMWRAYKFALQKPQCDRNLICELNRYPPGTEGSAGLKPGVTKLASLTASWFLSGHTGTPFWKLYNAAVEEHNCQVKYPGDCSQFLEEDLRITSEQQYVHNEL